MRPRDVVEYEKKYNYEKKFFHLSDKMTIFFDEKIFDIAQIVIYTNPLNEDGFLCLIEFNNNQGCILNISLNHITPKKALRLE